jgi:hypothetical protein
LPSCYEEKAQRFNYLWAFSFSQIVS